MRSLQPGAGASSGKGALDPYLRGPSGGGGVAAAGGAAGGDPPRLTNPGTMGVRAVAPAFDAERLAEAVRWVGRWVGG